MTDTKMLQAILDRVTTIDKKVNSVDKKMEVGFREVNQRIDKTNTRLDKIGKSVAYLEDDAPTIDEFNKLVRRVTKLENLVSEN